MLQNFGLIHQVYSLPDLIRQQYTDLEPKSRVVLSTPEIYNIQRIILTGCGDSYAASLAVKDAYAHLTGIPVEAIPAVELSRIVDSNRLGFAPNNPLVIAVSNSGSVVRVNEAMARAMSHGSATLAVTGNRESILAKNAKNIMDLNVPSFEAAPGTRSYVVTVMALLLIAIRIGEVRGKYTMDEAMAMRLDMLNQADQLEKMLPTIDEKMKHLAETWQYAEAYDFAGTGMEYGTAWYAHAKIIEQLGKYSFFNNTEDWLHTSTFIRNPSDTATVVFSDKRSPAFSRTNEMIGYAKALGRPLLVVGDGIKDHEDIQTVAVPSSNYTFNSCLTQFAPVSILGNYIANLIGEVDGRGCQGVFSIAKGAKCIRESEWIVL